jgi:hypothetical protein
MDRELAALFETVKAGDNALLAGRVLLLRSEGRLCIIHNERKTGVNLA